MAAQLFELLKQDHRQAESMMKQLSSLPPNQRESVFLDFNDALLQHMKLEEQFLYPRLQNLQECAELVQDALQEHQEARSFLQQMERMDANTQEWIGTLQKLQQGVQHHVQEEENEVFPKAQQLLNEKDIDSIGQKIAAEKEMGTPSRAGGPETERQL